MYRNKARAAHKLQQQYPPVNQQEQLPPGQNQQPPPPGNQQFPPGDPQQPPGAWNGQQQQQQPPGGGGVLMFNPSQYQNGVVEAPPVVPSQPDTSQQPVQQQQQPQVDQQQWNGDAHYGGAGGWNQSLATNQGQDVNHNVQEAQWQGYHQRQERSGSVLSDAGSSVSQHQQFQQQHYAGYQQQQEYQQPVQHPTDQQQNADQYQQQVNNQYQAVPENQHVDQYQQPAVDNQPQNVDPYKQSADSQNQQQAGEAQNSEQGASVAEPALQLILDDSGQWYWNYHQQQWQPYYGSDGTYPQDQQQNPAIEAVAETVAQEAVQGVVEDGGGVSQFYNNDVVEEIGQITDQISQLTVAAREVEPEKEKSSRRNSQMGVHSQGQMSADSHGLPRIRQDSQMSSDSYGQGHQMPVQAQYGDHMQNTQGSHRYGESIGPQSLGDSYGSGQFSERKTEENLGNNPPMEQFGNEYKNGVANELDIPRPGGDNPMTPAQLQFSPSPLIQFSPESANRQMENQPPGDSRLEVHGMENQSIPPTYNHVQLDPQSGNNKPDEGAPEPPLAPLPMFQPPPTSQEQPQQHFQHHPPPAQQQPPIQNQEPPLTQQAPPMLFQLSHQTPPQPTPPIQHQPPPPPQNETPPVQHQLPPPHEALPQQPPFSQQPPPQAQAPLSQHQPLPQHQAPPSQQQPPLLYQLPPPHQEPPSHQQSGPPDVVDHRPNTSQPEIVSDLEWSVTSSSQGSPAHQPHPDLHPQPPQPNQWRHGPLLPASQAPDITAHPVSSPSVIAGHPAPPASQQAVTHDQHYDYYKMPDVTAGRATPPQPLPAPPKAPDILRIPEPVMPSSDRNLFMETGELTEEDAVRVHPPAVSMPAQLPSMVTAPPPANAIHPPAHLPPMVGGNEPPSVSRMVLGDTLQQEFASNDRLVEGESVPTLPPLMQPSFDRSVEGESGIAPPPLNSLPNRQVEGGSMTSSPTIPPNSRRVEGEYIAPPPTMAPPPLRRVEGEAGPSVPPPTLPPGGREVEVEGESGPPVNPPPLMDQRIVTGLANQASPVGPPAVKLEVNSPSAFHPPASAFHPPPPTSQYHPQSFHPPPPTSEARSETVGSDRRDETVMGGPIGAKTTPLPTPGRDVAGSEGGVEERGHENGREKAVNKSRDKKNYDSDDDASFRDRDSGDSDQDHRYSSSRHRRTLSPESSRRSYRRGDRNNRSSTDRDEDSDRRSKYDNDRREYRKKHEYERSMQSEHNRSYYNDPDRKGNRHRQEHYRRNDRNDRNDRSDRNDRDRYRRRDYDDRSYHGGASVKEEPLDRSYNRSYKRDGEFDRSSVFEEDYARPSRPSSRTGSHYERDPMEALLMMQQQQAAMYQQQMLMQNPQYQQQVMMQEAVQKMEKAVADPANAKIYKQHWDHYQTHPQAFEKLRLEDPIQHHVLTQFAKKLLHLVEDKKYQNDNNNVIKDERKFSEDFHQLSSSHRAESRQGPEESTIYNENSMGLSGNFVDSVNGDMKLDTNVVPDRLTPVMFSRPHVCARIAPSGLLVKVEAASPYDGQNATIELHHMAALCRHLPESSEFTSFPGPLVPGETHKNDVIKFCEKKIQSARDRRSMTDRESYILLWEMLILLLRQNGQVEGSDIADLLLKDYTDPSSTPYANGQKAGSYAGSVKDGSSRFDGGKDDTMSSASSVHNEESSEHAVAYSKTVINAPPTEDVTCRFRDYLLHGNKHEGLEYAMREGLWGHALFLASKMDQRTYAGVMTRFANGLALNDPLQTLYQLMSSRQPTAMKQCADQRWGDWRPHLAMILSNQVAGNLNRQSMITLGDTLGSKGQLHAAQFCYIVSSCEFGTFTKRTSKLVLLCSTMSDCTLEEFATNEAIQCTEIYEFVQKLGHREFEMATLQVYKFLYAIRLLDNGLPGMAQHYCKIIADFVVRNPTRVETDFLPDFIFQLESLAERLKYQDPIYTTSVGEISEIADPDWLVKFQETVQTYFRGGNVVNTGAHEGSYENEDYSSLQYPSYGQQEQQNSYDQQQAYEQQNNYDQQYSYDKQQTYDQQQNYDQGVAPPSLNDGDRQDSPNQQPPDQNQQETGTDPTYPPFDAASQNYDSGNQMYDPSTYNKDDTPVSENAEGTDNATEAAEQSSQPVMFNPNMYSQNQTFFNPNNFNNPTIPEEAQVNDSRRPSLVAMSRRSRTTSQTDANSPPIPTTSSPPNFSLYEGIRKSPPTQAQPPPVSQSQPAATAPAKVEKKKEPGKPNQKTSWVGGLFGKLFKGNQAHLPDDKNPAIVFDEKLGRWVNTEGEEDDLAPAAPPPMDSSFTAAKSRPGGPAPPGPGSYSMLGAPGKRKGRGYVDVFAKAGTTTPAAATPSMLLNPASAPPRLAPAPAILIPGAGMPLDPANMPTSFPTAEGSSSPVVTSVTAPDNGPTFFNPSSMAGVTGPPAF